MSFREITMIDVKEVLRRWQAGQGVRQIAREAGTDRKTVRRYIDAAEGAGLERASNLGDGDIHEVLQRVQSRPLPTPSMVRKTLETVRPRVEAYLAQERPLRLVRIHELLMREGHNFSYTALRRYAHAELGWRERPLTVRVDDPPPGQEAQIDFGHMGYLVDAEGKRRKLWALLVTLSCSRYQFVWPTLTQTVTDVIAGLEAAWRFFGGVPHRVVPDNASSMVIRAHAQAPVIHKSFLEYAQSRGFFVDPARVRQPQDKPRVENQVAYVRERCFDGERLVDVEAARRHAETWCRDVAGARVHGTTRQVPREAYESLERGHMLALPSEPFDVPAWTKAKVHPDHHVQVGRALYSVPTAHVGKTLDVRVDSSTVRLYASSELVKLHRRVAPGKRSTDPSDYPSHKAAYALRSVDGVKTRARAHGEHVGIYAERLLSGPLPWTKMRQAYGLLRLCERYGNDRVETLCARALAFEVVDVPRIERMLKTAARVETEATTQGKLVSLPGRFARDASTFSTTSKPAGGES